MLVDDLVEVEMLVLYLLLLDFVDVLEVFFYDVCIVLWCLVFDDKCGEVLLEVLENVWGDLIDKMSDFELLQVMQLLDIDEQVYLLQYLLCNLIGWLLVILLVEKCVCICQIMCYVDNSVGLIMEFEVIMV